MNLRIIIIALSSLYLLSLTACIKEVDDIDLPDENPELVVASFLSPSDTINSLVLTWSKPIFGNQSNSWGYAYEEDAIVTVSDGSQNHTFTYNPMYQSYTLDTNSLKCQAGKTYTLKVTHNNTEISAKTRIPVEPVYKIEHLNSVTTYKDDWYTEYKHSFIFTIENNADTNYYRILLQNYRNGYVNTYNEVYVKGSNGNEVKVDAVSYYNSTDSVSSEDLKVFVLNCSESYYHYHNSVRNYSGDNPFGEPTIIYSNVNDGLGVFAAYQMKEENFYLPVP